MKAAQKAPESIDDYIAAAAPEARPVLREIRATIRKAAPKAQEKISYRIPAFFLDGVLVYFAAFKKHIGFFPPVRDKELKKAAAVYAGEKGNLRFPLDEPIPYTLIGKLVRARVKENTQKAGARRPK